jgi:hypothetical protein
MLVTVKPTPSQMVSKDIIKFRSQRRSIQNHLCDQMGVIHIHSHAVWLEKCPCSVFPDNGHNLQGIYIHGFLEVYLDDWIVFSSLKEHMQALRLMLDRYRQLQIFGILLGHVVCKDRLLVDLAKIVAILDMVAPTLVREMGATLGHTGYYRRFI